MAERSEGAQALRHGQKIQINAILNVEPRVSNGNDDIECGVGKQTKPAIVLAPCGHLICREGAHVRPEWADKALIVLGSIHRQSTMGWPWAVPAAASGELPDRRSKSLGSPACAPASLADRGPGAILNPSTGFHVESQGRAPQKAPKASDH